MSDAREEVIDFTEPFMDVGLSALYKKAEDGGKRPFDTLEEMIEDNDMQYGLLRGGMTENFFSQSKNETIKKIWDKIQKMASPGGRFSNSNDGQKKVRESGGKFVFFMESATADYYKNKKSCELDTLPIAKKNKYAFGVQKGSEFKTGINKAIKQLKESGRIQEIRDKWWTGECVPRDKGNSIHTTMTSASLVLLGATLYLML